MPGNYRRTTVCPPQARSEFGERRKIYGWKNQPWNMDFTSALMYSSFCVYRNYCYGASTTEQKFVLHWGEMGTRWGINRTVAQGHALLFLSPKALHAEEIASTLAVARSNVSTSLRELQGWGIVRLMHVLGDRRDHFESVKDVWESFRTIAEGRKRREIDPTLRVLQECVVEIKSAGSGSEYTRERLEEMLQFLSTSNPAPMQEWTPYANVDPPHLHGFLVSNGGQFLLTPLPNGGTRLEGTTWYHHGLWSATYWRWWSDAIIHRIHMRLLTHIRDQAEKDAVAREKS
jgi:DNA-binding transcriptional regulator GbsR (MarR family)